jgi:hypothetical protein
MPRVEVSPGKYVNERTAAMLREVQRITRHPVLVAQGSPSLSVSVSGQTHAGQGAVDMRTVPLSKKGKLDQLIASRRVGFAAWIRPYVPDLWGEHEHALAIDDPGLSTAAEAQVQAYLHGRDGLAGNRKDPHAGLNIAPTTFEKYLATQRGQATVLSATVGRVSPSRDARKRTGTNRARGYRINFVRMVWSHGELWLVTKMGTYYLSGKTTRGA